MIFTLLLSLIISLTYLCYTVWVSKGIPVSISDSYYLLGKRGWLFQLVMASVAFMLYPVWVSVCSEELAALVFGACSSLLFVAVSPCFKLDLEGKVHYSFALLCCCMAVVWQLCEGLCAITLCCGIVGMTLVVKDKAKWCWWVECAVLSSVYLSLFRLLSVNN